MKTVHNLTLILHKLCNQSNESRNRSKSKKLILMFLPVLISLIPLQKVKAVQSKEIFYNYYTIKPPQYNTANPLTTIDISFMYYSFVDNYNCVRGLTVSYLSPTDNITYIKLFDYSYGESNNRQGFTSASYNIVSGTFNSVGKLSSTLTSETVYFPANAYFKAGYLFQNTAKWDFPPCLLGKPIKLKVEGLLQEAFNNGNWPTGFTVYYDLPVSPSFNPVTTFSYTPASNGKKWLKWKNNTIGGVSKIVLYSDPNYTNKVDSAIVTPTSIKDDSVISVMPAENLSQSHTYYAKQFFNASGPSSGTNFVTYSKTLGQCSHPGYKFPTIVTATPQLSVNPIKIDFAITEGNTSSPSASKYYIKRNGVYLGVFTGINYTDATASPLTDYTYVVYTVPDAWTDKTIVIPELSYTITTSTKPNPISFENFKFQTFKGTNPYIKILWDNTQWYPVNNTIKLYRKNTTTGEFTTDLGVQNTASSYSDFTDIIENKYFTYKLEITQWGKVTSKIDSVMVVDQASISKIAATKNTFGDRINLQWTIDRLNLCDRFEIWRSFAFTTSNGDEAWSDEVLVNQFTAQSLLNSWDDRDAAPGTLYKYKVVAIKKTATIPAFDIKVNATDIGFRMPVGVVTGRITYGAGTAVKGTSLYVSSSGTGGDLLYKSLKFSGDNSQGGQVNLKKTKHGCIADKGFTFQAWLQPLNRNAVSSTIFEVGGEYSIRMNSDNILVMMGNSLQQVRSYKLESTIAENSFFHLTVAYSLDKNLKIFINGVAKDSVTLTNTYTCSFNETTTKSSLANNTVDVEANPLPFNGNIDDVRLWNRGITNTEAADTYNRYLGGSEIGLIGYWPMDEGIGTYAFDCSKTDKVFNECHITDIKKGTSETVVPKKEQLSIKGVTDADGNYIIGGIPFTGDGSTYSITPVMGTHKFEPKQQLRYISPSSLIHNSTDFTDKSSFPVKIKVKYSNTQYPVPGVIFYVDENPCSIENKLVSTASQLSYDNTRIGQFKTIDAGECIIDVPIGEHYIRAELSGHTFEKNGRWPAVGKQVFNENTVTTIDFADTTLVTVVGRVVGGAVENSYPIGFKNSDKQKNHSSHANIGKAQIIMEPTILKNYFLNDGSSDKIQPLSTSESIKFGSVAKYKANSNKVEIFTDPQTGEYMVKLPPIQWDINSVKTSTDAQYKNDLNIITDIQTFTTNKQISAIDTAKIIQTNKVDSFSYNIKKSFVYQAPTVIEVRDAEAGSIAFGESEWQVSSPGLPVELRKLYTVNGNTPNSVKYLYGITTDYPNGKPVFAQKKQYALNIYAFESYKHPEGLDTTTMKQFARVPLQGAVVTIKNEIGVLSKKVVPDASDTLESNVMKLDNNGRVNYIFKAGFPNLADVNSGLGLSISIKNGTSASVDWKEMGNFRAIVTGCEPIAGTDFVTKGPVVPLVVLRDPPGSNSYAYMEKGTTLSYSFVDKSVFNGNFSAISSIRLGVKLTTAIGFGFMSIAEMENKNTLKVGVEGEYSNFSGKTGGSTYTTKELIQTSASPDFVGSNADVYIGTSTNLYYCQSKELNIQKNGLAVDTVSSSSFDGDTEFRFSQNEIVTAQIPKWKQILNQLLICVPEANFNAAKSSYQTLANSNKTNYYITTLNQSNENFGMVSGTYTIIRPTKTNFPDTIEIIANTIKSWQNVISNNESQKKNASNNILYKKDNISFDAGATIERSYTYTDSKGTTNGATDKTQAVLGTSFGFAICSVGMQMDLETKMGGGSESENNSSTENTTTFGYVLSDPDADNRFAVNVYKNRLLDPSEPPSFILANSVGNSTESLGSYIFELGGGQSSCPYEVADSSLYYRENNKTVVLARGTTPLDAPYISIKNYTKTDIPNGKDATFVLELGNNSIIQSPRAYMLSVDDTSNPNGAIVSVDGTPLTSGRLFYVTPGQTLTKTLTLHQTKLDVLDYPNIKLNFSSVCDTINKTQNINVTYIPSCSDLDITLDRQTINTENSAPLAVTLKNFNQEYKNFLGLQLDYKLDGDTKWNSKVFAKDQNAKTTLALKNISTDMLIPNTGSAYLSSFVYNLSFNGLNDGTYTVRAKTLCDNGTQTPINNITAELNVIKDLVNPTSMGVPSPADGILTPETEVAVTFNENIQTSKLIPDNFEVKGVLNGAALQHAEGLALDGTAKSQAFTESTLSLQNSSFAIEGWVRTSTDCLNYGNLFTIGTGSDKVSLNMKKDELELRVNDVLVSSKSITAKADWQYISLTYDVNSQTMSVNLLTSNSNSTPIIQKLSAPVNPVGRLLVGAGFKGNIHQVAVWSDLRSVADLSDMNTAKTGAENNLIGYWPMNEAYGTIAADKARSRNMIVNSSWFIEPNGKAAVYNGTNQSTLIKSGTIPFTSNNNYSIEFWFKGKSQTNATLFSCGKGDADVNPIEKLSVGVNNSGELSLYSKGKSYVIPGVSVLDTIWHHFAMSVLRGSNTNVYIDGLQKLQLTSSKIGGMASDQIALGSRRYTDSTLVDGKYNYINVQDRYFNGSLDEVRIWGSALTAENIRLDMHSRLTGIEAGLLAYYPFEETSTGGVTAYSLKDFSVSNSGVAISNSLSSDNTPGIKIARTKEDVSFSYIASDNKIVFSIDAPLSKIENCILEFAVKKVYDFNGNMLASPIKWTAFVNNNRLNWETDQVALTKQVLAAQTFKAVIVNKSGKYENFVIDGLPSWLTVNKSSGKLNPLEKAELTFTVDNGINVGSYESRVTLTGNNGIQEMLPVSLKVTGPRPDWFVNPYDYLNSMNVIGQIKIDGVFQEDPEDMLAAFIGTKCVGIVNPQFSKTLNSYIFYMDIYGNTEDEGKSLTFSLWDAGTGRIYPGVDVIGGALSFYDSSIKGSVVSPMIFNATDKVEQQLSIKKGWNWISTNVVNNEPSNLLMKQLQTGLETDGLQIKSQFGSTIISDIGWEGNLQSLSTGLMYLLQSTQPKNVKLIGSTAKSNDFEILIYKKPDPITNPNTGKVTTFQHGWSWIGYVPQFVAPVQEAFSGLIPNEGDVIKGQLGFATYSGGAWFGSLQYLVPGSGYMYGSTSSAGKTFVYPSQYISRSNVMMQSKEATTFKWNYITGTYPSSMIVNAVVKINDDEMTSTNLQVGAFIDDECRGVIELSYNAARNRYFAYLSVWGSSDDTNKKITFKCYNPTTDKELVASDKTSDYIMNTTKGTTASPYLISCNTTTDQSEFYAGDRIIYPNPVVNTLNFNYEPSGIELFEIVDCTGRTQVYSKVMNKNSVNVGGLIPGIYSLRVTYKGTNYVHRFIKM